MLSAMPPVRCAPTASGTSKAFGDAAGLAAALRDWTPGRDLPVNRLADWERTAPAPGRAVPLRHRAGCARCSPTPW
ncbi:hypothetical protein ACFQ3Z_00705 [Streptomyces nogalater]